jgi:hypothetical protein
MRSIILEVFKYGDPNANTVLIQPVDNHDLAFIENEIAEIQNLTNRSFHLLAVKVNHWNNDLSPWQAPAVFGNESFGDGANKYLDEILRLTTVPDKTYYLGGYSLAGLFVLWAASQTDVFRGIAAASPSVWFPDFTDYMKQNRVKCQSVYLSLGDQESKTRNAVMATVSDRICEVYDLLNEQGVRCVLEWNQGNHFREPDIRTAKAFAWVMQQS